jgi:hypothetical protein
MDNTAHLSCISQVLYNGDCISDQAIIYWHQKGSKPQGRQHFVKATEALVKVCIQSFAYLAGLPICSSHSSCKSKKRKAKRSRRTLFLSLSVSICLVAVALGPRPICLQYRSSFSPTK